VNNAATLAPSHRCQVPGEDFAVPPAIVFQEAIAKFDP
jgi:hypothetical protein